MAVFTPVSEAEARVYLQAYDLGELRSLTPIAEGVENTNYRLETTAGPFVLTLFEYRTRADALPFCLGLTAHLAGRGYPAPRPMPDRERAWTGYLNGRPAAIIEWREGDWLRTPDLDDQRTAGRALARLHLAAADYVGLRSNPVGPAVWRDLADRCASVAVGEDRRILERLEQELADMVRRPLEALPEGPVHADYFPDNVLFLNGEISGVIDFYFACIDTLAYDLAIALNAWGFDAAGRADPAALAAFLAGYESVRPLSRAERAALPDLGARAVVRFSLTRLHDRLLAAPDALVTAKDPAPFLRRLDYWRAADRPVVAAAS
jgi:homoserine kinase type II